MVWSFACSEPPVWAGKGAFPLEEGAWQGCSPSLAQVQHLTRSVLHHFCAGALAREHSWMLCRIQCAAWLAALPRGCSACSHACGCRCPGTAPSPLGHCLAVPSPAQALTPEGSEQFVIGFPTPEVEIVALWCSCCAGVPQLLPLLRAVWRQELSCPGTSGS